MRPKVGAEFKAAARIVLFFLIAAVGLAVGLSGYLHIPSASISAAFKLGVLAALAVITIISYPRPQWERYRQIAVAMLSVSFGIVLAWLIGMAPWDRIGPGTGTPAGMTFAKLREAVPIVAAILAGNALSGRRLDSLHLSGGRVGLSLGLGLLGCLLPLGAFAALGGLGTTVAAGAQRLFILAPWIVAISLANGFMEELWFRGIWLNRTWELIGTGASLLLTVAVFTAWHVLIYWGQPLSYLVQMTIEWAVLGLACGWITVRTRSLWGAVLCHAVGDVTFFLGLWISS